MFKLCEESKIRLLIYCGVYYCEKQINITEKHYLWFDFFNFFIINYFCSIHYGFFQITFVLGILYGIVIAVVSYCDKVKRTIVAMLMGMLSAVVSQLILIISGITYEIIFYIYRNDTWVKETGRLSVNEVIGYNWGSMSFWHGLLISFVILIISIFLFNTIKRGKK